MSYQPDVQKITLITCTGGRSDAFDLCIKYMKAQTIVYDQWIVVNDHYTQSELDKIQPRYPEFELHAGPRKWEAGLNTHRFNLEEALKYVTGDYIFFIEDDDYYSPKYLDTMFALLEQADVVGEGNAKYFNLQVPGFKEMHNTAHASLCQTALRKSALPLLKNAIDSGELYFDIHFWRAVREKKVSNIILNEKNLCIGIKGMPGRAGIGVGHRGEGYLYDGGLNKLQEWTNKATADIYRPFIRKYDKLPVKPKTK